MATKATGISREFIIHPGEMISDVINDRGITQAELAKRTGVSDAYVSSIISGKKNISANFAMALEYALGIAKSFWLNLQANYDAEILAADEIETVTDQEIEVFSALRDIVKYLRSIGRLPVAQQKKEAVLSLRKVLKVSNLSNLNKLAPAGAFRMAENTPVNKYVLGAWLQLYVENWNTDKLKGSFSEDDVPNLITEIKGVINTPQMHPQQELPCILSRYGIDIRIVHNFKGAPVQGFITKKKDNCYQIVLTIRGAWADIFWFSLFHEIGHIVNGDVNKNGYYCDTSEKADMSCEAKADAFASAALINPKDYDVFVSNADFSYNSIKHFSENQNVPEYIVIGRLQREGHIPYQWFSQYKKRYKWKN